MCEFLTAGDKCLGMVLCHAWLVDVGRTFLDMHTENVKDNRHYQFTSIVLFQDILHRMTHNSPKKACVKSRWTGNTIEIKNTSDKNFQFKLFAFERRLFGGRVTKFRDRTFYNNNMMRSQSEHWQVELLTPTKIWITTSD